MKRWFMIIALVLTALPGTARAWWQDDWAFRKQLTVDASPTGLNITGPVGRVPVLVRLHSGNFQFADALENGADIRIIAADDKTPLTYHIENFDALLGVATLWVDIPKLDGGQKVLLWLYYGNKKAPPAVESAKTFDADQTLVFHYDDAPAAPAADKTAYHNSAKNAVSGTDEGGIIGHSGKFNGTAGLTVPASPSLATPAGGQFTFSTWAKPDKLDPNAVIYARGGMTIALVAGVPTVTGAGASVKGTAPIAAGQWSHIAVTADGKSIKLYVNGQDVASADGTLPALSADTIIGGTFVGELDETRISKVARSTSMILADANGQGPQAKLLTFGTDEKQGGHGGYFGIIFSHLTPDAKVVIGILAVMGAIAGWVMWTKAMYLSKLDKANEIFLEHYRKLGGDMNKLDNANHVPADVLEDFEDSSIYRIYHAGAEEIQRRNRNGEIASLHPEAVEVVRSLMDAKQVRENQSLSKWMVMLTIAISGGPFVGLLGTVIGVMITFAAIAEAGDVNINAIAPGISAALLATVAGMAVAIPSLFGYNYLTIRIKNIAANMQVFVDEFIARTGEAHSQKPNHLRAAE